MKTNKDFILREIVGECVLVPTGKAAQQINGMIHLSETGAFIWRLYDQKESLDEIVEALVEEYNVSKEQARIDVYGFTKVLYDDQIVLDIPEMKEEN